MKVFISKNSRREEWEEEYNGDLVQAFYGFIDYLINMYGTSSVRAFTCDVDENIFNVRLDDVDYDVFFD